MSYASLVRTLPESFRSTNGLAALASLGIHGLALIVLPFLPFDSQSTALEQQRTVGLVELTPEEQSRLPNAAPVPSALPPFATQESTLPPLPPPPSFAIGALPPFPNPIVIPPSPLNRAPASNNFQNSIRPNQTFMLPSNVQPNNQPRINQPNNQAIATGPTLNTLPPPPVFSTLPPPPPLGNLQPPPSVSNQSQNRNQTYNSGEILPPVPQWRQPANAGLPAMRLNPATPFAPEAIPPTQTAQIPVPPNNIQPQQNQNLTPQPQSPPPQQQVAAANPQPQPSPEATQKLPERGRQELLALQQKIRQERAASAASATPTPSPADPARRQQIVAALRNNSTTTPAQSANGNQPQAQAQRQQIVAALRNNQSTGSNQTSAAAEREAQLQAWAKRQNTVQQNHSNILTKAPIYRTIKTCQRGTEGLAVVGVVVNPEGKIVSGPDFLSKKGAAGIEQAAKEYVQEYQFPKNESSVNQQFHLQYQYDSVKCSQPVESESNTPAQQPASQSS